jgi:hypothetical protein
MKQRAFILALIALALLITNVSAAPNAYQVPIGIFSAGGGRIAAGNFVIDGSIGQTFVGVVATSPYQVCSGFWCTWDLYAYFLPNISK